VSVSAHAARRLACYTVQPVTRSCSRILATIGPPIVSTVAAIALLCAVGEVFFRFRAPFSEPVWPLLVDSTFGTTFIPGKEVRVTNGVDFWTATRANSIGFLDREPPGAKASGTCRVLFVGDSFVEAAQVPIEQKLQVVFEQIHRERLPEQKVETLALGFSGTGQANQLQFYDVFGHNFAPDVVVLVFVNNDFANNSAVLEAVRNGWHPDHAPRLFFRRDRRSGQFVPAPVDADYASFRLPAPPAPPDTRLRRLHRSLRSSSRFYSWLFSQLSIQYPAAVSALADPPISETYAFRMRVIEQLPGYADVFTGWRYPDDLHPDRMFYTDELPPVFAEADALTAHALDEFAARGKRDGFELLVLAPYGMSKSSREGETEHGRRLVDAGARKRLEALLAPRGIPLVDQMAWIDVHGGSADEAHFSRDGHWSPKGHLWAAQAVLDYFVHHPDLCGTDRRSEAMPLSGATSGRRGSAEQREAAELD